MLDIAKSNGPKAGFSPFAFLKQQTTIKYAELGQQNRKLFYQCQYP